jgi:hypothetical protein
MTGKRKDRDAAHACEALCMAILARAEVIEALTTRKPREGVTGYASIAATLGAGAGEIVRLAEALGMLARQNDPAPPQTIRRTRTSPRMRGPRMRSPAHEKGRMRKPRL